jgi:hypothetical protein
MHNKPHEMGTAAITAAEMLAAKQYADSKFYEPFDALTRSGKQVWYAYYNGYLTGIKQNTGTGKAAE